jgi:hypothetical protein
MNVVERGELYLRLRAERLLDTTHSAWREVDTGAVQHITAIAEALVALGVIDNTTFTSVLSDLELAGWLRQRVLGEITRVRAVLSESFSPPRPAWPPSVLACPVTIELEDDARLHLCWLTRRGRAGPTQALIRAVVTPPLIAGGGEGGDDRSSEDLPRRLGLDQVVLVDDRGASYTIEWDTAARHPLATRSIDGESGEVVDFVVSLRPEPPSAVRRLELRPQAGTSSASECDPPHSVDVAKRPHQSATPAQVYLASLLGLLPHALPAGSEKARPGVAAAVAGALVDLGLIEASDDLVLRAQSSGGLGLPGTFAPMDVDFGDGPASSAPVHAHPVGRELDLRGVRIFVEGYVLSGRHVTVYLQLAEGARRVTAGLAGPPWFGLIDDQGRTYRLAVRSENGRELNVSLPGGLSPDVREARFFVETPFESTWLDLDLAAADPSTTPATPAPAVAGDGLP